jgi:hypothetical protein
MKATSNLSANGSFSSFILYTLAFCFAICGAARADEFSKVSHHSVRMFSYGLLTIETRTGDIRSEGWDEPRLEVEAEKVVRAKSEAAAQPLYERLQVELVGQDKNVVIRTQYPPRRLWRPFRGESTLSVNYLIHMPYDANLRLKCVDGDVSIIGLVGAQQVRVNYGDVEIRVPDVEFLRSLRARSLLGYVQSDLNGADSAGFAQGLSYWNPKGGQDISISVRMGGIFVYREN